MTDFNLDKTHTDNVERNIAPPLARAITVPVLIDGKDTGVVIYVGQSSFREKVVSVSVLQKIADSLSLSTT
jgi:hypothetical protein